MRAISIKNSFNCFKMTIPIKSSLLVIQFVIMAAQIQMVRHRFHLKSRFHSKSAFLWKARSFLWIINWLAAHRLDSWIKTGRLFFRGNPENVFDSVFPDREMFIKSRLLHAQLRMERARARACRLESKLLLKRHQVRPMLGLCHA